MTLAQKLDIIILKYNIGHFKEHDGAIPEWYYDQLHSDILELFKKYNPEQEDFGIGIDKIE